MKHGRSDYTTRIQDAAHVIPEDEPVFLLRGQDPLAAETVRFWAELYEQEGADPELVESARNQADVMEAWEPKKLADLPEKEEG